MVAIELDANNDTEAISPVCNEILGGFQGTYVRNKFGSQYWESVMILRRLLLRATSLLYNPTIQMASCVFLSIVFLLHHVYVHPFVYTAANVAESFSLLLLCIVSVINLLKICVY